MDTTTFDAIDFPLLNAIYSHQKEILKNVVFCISAANDLANALNAFLVLGSVLDSEDKTKLTKKFLHPDVDVNVDPSNDELVKNFYTLNSKTRKHGEQISYYLKSGSLRSTVFFKDGKKEGKERIYFNHSCKGVPCLWSERFYVDGKLEGEQKIVNCCSGGVLSLTYREKGLRQGPYWSWCCNEDNKGSCLDELCHYKDDKKHGECTKWEDNGDISEHGFYNEGKREGLYIAWEDKVVLVEAIFSEGKFVEYLYKSDHNPERVEEWEHCYVKGVECEACKFPIGCCCCQRN